MEAQALRTFGIGQRDQAMLDFEKGWWSLPGTKESEIRSRFELSPTRYYQVLNALIDNPAALDYDPLLVKRLRRQRDQRQRSRSAARLGLVAK